jgi:hypothetical protein
MGSGSGFPTLWLCAVLCMPRVPQDKEKIIRPCPSIRGLRWRQLSEGTHSRSSPIPAVTIYCELGRSGSGDQCVGSNASPWHRCSGDTSIPGLNGARSQRLDRSRRSLAGGFFGRAHSSNDLPSLGASSIGLQFVILRDALAVRQLPTPSVRSASASAFELLSLSAWMSREARL